MEKLYPVSKNKTRSCDTANEFLIPGSERGRGEEQLELRGLVLQAVAHLERAPGKTKEEEMATHSSILAWKIPWTEEPGRLQSMG